LASYAEHVEKAPLSGQASFMPGMEVTQEGVVDAITRDWQDSDTAANAQREELERSGATGDTGVDRLSTPEPEARGQATSGKAARKTKAAKPAKPAKPKPAPVEQAPPPPAPAEPAPEARPLAPLTDEQVQGLTQAWGELTPEGKPQKPRTTDPAVKKLHQTDAVKPYTRRIASSILVDPRSGPLPRRDVVPELGTASWRYSGVGLQGMGWDGWGR